MTFVVFNSPRDYFLWNFKNRWDQKNYQRMIEDGTNIACFDNTGRKQIESNKSWLGKFKHYTKRVHRVVIGSIIEGKKLLEKRGPEKKNYQKTSHEQSGRKTYTNLPGQNTRQIRKKKAETSINLYSRYYLPKRSKFNDQ